MEVVLLLVAIVGVALIAVPRLQARRAGAASRRRTRARVKTRAAVATPVATSWTPAPVSSEEDVWDDDLGWEGEDAGPATRDEWNRWRDSQAPEPSEPEPTALPSVDRWRERAASSE